MEAFKERLVNEFDDLNVKHEKLLTFMNENSDYKKLDSLNQILLQQQAAWMLGYKTVLAHRIAIILSNDEVNEFTNKRFPENETV